MTTGSTQNSGLGWNCYSKETLPFLSCRFSYFVEAIRKLTNIAALGVSRSIIILRIEGYPNKELIQRAQTATRVNLSTTAFSDLDLCLCLIYSRERANIFPLFSWHQSWIHVVHSRSFWKHHASSMVEDTLGAVCLAGPLSLTLPLPDTSPLCTAAYSWPPLTLLYLPLKSRTLH